MAENYHGGDGTEGPLSPLYVDEIQAAQISGIRLSTLRSHRHRRKGLPYIKIGRLVRYAVSDLPKRGD